MGGETGIVTGGVGRRRRRKPEIIRVDAVSRVCVLGVRCGLWSGRPHPFRCSAIKVWAALGVKAMVAGADNAHGVPRHGTGTWSACQSACEKEHEADSAERVSMTRTTSKVASNLQ